MTERYKIVHSRSLDVCDIQDTHEEVPTFYNDLGHILSVQPVCDLLNEKETKIDELTEENQKLNKHINSSVQYIDAIIEANECEIRWATNNNVDCSFAKYVNEELEKIKRRILYND